MRWRNLRVRRRLHRLSRSPVPALGVLVGGFRGGRFGAASGDNGGAGATPTAVSAGTTVNELGGLDTVNGAAVSGYIVKRYNATTGSLRRSVRDARDDYGTDAARNRRARSDRGRYTITPVVATNWIGRGEPEERGRLYRSHCAPDSRLARRTCPAAPA